MSMDSELPMSLRRQASERLYQMVRQQGGLRPLHDEPSLADFTHWRIIANRFPYDSFFVTHDLLLPKRVVGRFVDLSQLERGELEELLAEGGYVDGHYDAYFVSTVGKRSIPSHCHAHLLGFHPNRSEVGL